MFLPLKTVLICVLRALPLFLSDAQTSNCGNLSVADGLSQSSVISIIQDTEGYLWFGTRDGANRYDGHDFLILRHDPTDSCTISDSYINCMAAFDGGVWFGTSDGLNRYDSQSGQIRRYAIGYGSSNDITTIKIWGHGLLIGTVSGLYFMDGTSVKEILRPEGAMLRSYGRIYCLAKEHERILVGHDRGMDAIDEGVATQIFDDDAVNQIAYDSNDGSIYFSCFGRIDLYEMRGNGIITHNIINMPFQKHEILIKSISAVDETHLLIGMVDGLHVFDKKTGTVSSKNYMLTHMSVESTFIDNSGTIWAGTYAGGVDYEYTYPPVFSFYPSNDGKRDLGVLGKIVNDPENKCLWIGSDISGLVRFDMQSSTFSKYLRIGSKGQVGINNNIKSISLHCGKLYAGFYNGALGVFDPRELSWTDEIRMKDPKAIYGIKWDKQGRIIMATYDDNGIKTIKDGCITNLYSPQDSNWNESISHLTDVELLGDTTLVGTRRNGIFLFSKDQKLKHITSSTDPSIAGNRISQIYIDKRGRVLIGTYDGGLSICREKEIRTLTVEDGLASNSVCSIIEDDTGDIWVVCRAGISHMDANDNVIMTYDHEYGIKVQEFSPNSIAKSSDGTIWVGGIDGLVSFRPSDIKVNTHIPPVAITDIKVNNRTRSAVKGETLNLKHNENNLTLYFSALNYIFPGKNQYKYMMEGSDHVWIASTGNKSVSYNNLRPGKYTFKVMGSNNDGIWNPDPESLRIKINPAPWNSWWSWTVYLLIVTIIIYIIAHVTIERRRMAEEVKKKTNEVEDSKRRIAMYTDITHDLRTPLSLILSPLEDMISSSDASAECRKGMIAIHANAERMHRIVDQMMDLRSQEEGKATLRAAEGDIAGFTEEIFIAFKYQAEKKRINYTFSSKKKPVMAWYDRVQFEKVLMNVIGNAFKFTPDEGSVNIRVEENESDITIAVKDSGIGISKEDQDKIFTPFYRASSQGYYEGSGIGLSVAANIVKQHGGEISVESAPHEGTTFIIKLPLGCEHLKESEILVSYSSSEKVERYYEHEEELAEAIIPNRRNTVLVVEDNTELRQYIVHSLSKYWKVVAAANGEEGYSMALSYMPTVIVSDIMMPVMDGLEMCQKIKGNTTTSHIHVILLTARTLTVQMREGLEFGADDYLHKPFSMNLLAKKIGNIISSRNGLKNLFGETLSMENLGVKIDAKKADENFLQKINSNLLDFITDPQHDMDRLCKSVGMSKATLYRKIESATGMSPSRYIKRIRLNLACKLLSETDMTITEIASETGFSSIGHFSNSFKQAFGVSPKDYGSSHLQAH